MEDERRRILEMVEQGKISSTEAHELMQALKGPPTRPSSPPGPGGSQGTEPDALGLPVSLVAAAARWLAVAAASVAFALRWAVGLWRGQRAFRRRHH